MIEKGDILKPDFGGSLKYYVVIRVDKETLDIVQIFPIEKELTCTVINREELDHFEYIDEIDSERGKTLIGNINRRRKESGYKNLPSLEMISRQLQTQDIIRYDELLSVDECLDALCDLDALHKNFGDEAYLQLKEVVVKRLEDVKRTDTTYQKRLRRIRRRG